MCSIPFCAFRCSSTCGAASQPGFNPDINSCQHALSRGSSSAKKPIWPLNFCTALVEIDGRRNPDALLLFLRFCLIGVACNFRASATSAFPESAYRLRFATSNERVPGGLMSQFLPSKVKGVSGPTRCSFCPKGLPVKLFMLPSATCRFSSVRQIANCVRRTTVSYQENVMDPVSSKKVPR